MEMSDEKLDAILGKGKWRVVDKTALIYNGKLNSEQRRKLEVLVTYTGEPLELREEAPAVESPNALTIEHGTAIATGLHAMILQRAKGLEKYGVAIEDAGLSADELCEHAQQEMADGLVYVSELRQQIKRDIGKAVGEHSANVLAIVDDESKSQEMRLAIIREMLLTHSNGARTTVMYAQQSQLEQRDTNLLTLSRARNFPFLTALKVTA